MDKRKALGRGFDALMPDASEGNVDLGLLTADKNAGVHILNVSDIVPGKYQPRSAFKQDKLNELVLSIKEKGVVQPVLVRRTDSGYELIAGERRLRAAKVLGMAAIPAIIKDVDDLNAMEMALIENLQREDLNPIEEAFAYQKLSGEFNFTQEQIAQAIGRDRASVANTLRLLNLPEEIQRLLSEDLIQMGHARALLAVGDKHKQARICEKIVQKGLSVREVEFLVRPHAAPRKQQPYHNVSDPHTQAAQDELEKILGTKVVIQHRKKRGKIVIDYYSLDDLNRILDLVKNTH
ncbi:MAG: ParB/RepB/Spo0J family partition protein [Candidatus Omnitrophota bacterium]